MPSADLPSLLSGLFGVGIQLVMPMALFAWGRSIATRRGGRAWRAMSYVPLAALLAALVGFLVTVLGLMSAFGAASSAPPSERASQLAEGISLAMWGTAVGVSLSTLGYGVSAIAFGVAELRIRRARSAASAHGSACE